jgi:hypothetical protein
MDTKRSLLHSPTTCPYPDPDQCSLCLLTHFLKIHFNIILTSTPGSPKWSCSLRSCYQNPVCNSPLPHTEQFSRYPDTKLNIPNDTNLQHTQSLQLQKLSAGKLYILPLWLVSGTGSCLVLVIYSSHLDVVFKSARFLVIWMLFSNLRDFISYFFVPLLLYSITLLFSIYENVTTKYRGVDHIKLLPPLRCTREFQIIMQKCVSFLSVTISISIWTDTHLSYCSPCRWHGGRHCVVLALSGTPYCSSLACWLTPLCNCKRRERTV